MRETRTQTDTYQDAYSHRRRLRRVLRYDIRYRCRRLHEVAMQLGIDVSGARVLDFGFGGGDLLASFPPGCEIAGVEISRSAVEEARGDPRFAGFDSATFTLVDEDAVENLPRGPFDIVISSHSLEHVGDDAEVLVALRGRLRPGGTLFLFVPIEEPGYNPDHVRCYSPEGIRSLVERCGLEVLFEESSMRVHGHAWKLLTIPSRRRWPVLGEVANGIRLLTIAPIPYRGIRIVDGILERLGVGARQAFIVGRRPLST